jgi:hypothetical protein
MEQKDLRIGPPRVGKRVWPLTGRSKPLKSNGGSVFEPAFNPRRPAAHRHHARRRPGLPGPRLCRRRHARDRGGRRPLARQSLSLLPRQGRNPLLLPEPIARSAARGAGRRAPRSCAAACRAPARDGGRPRPLPARRSRGIGGAPRGRRVAAAAARADRRQARSLRTRRARDRRRRHQASRPARHRRHGGDAGLSRRAQLDRALVPARRAARAARPRPPRRRLCGCRSDITCLKTPISR